MPCLGVATLEWVNPTILAHCTTQLNYFTMLEKFLFYNAEKRHILKIQIMSYYCGKGGHSNTGHLSQDRQMDQNAVNSE